MDERQELFPEGFSRGRGMDVLSGCGKAFGLDLVLRTLGPEYIALDEITAQEDAASLAQAAGCGVRGSWQRGSRLLPGGLEEAALLPAIGRRGDF